MKSKRGFSYIEALVAVTIFAVLGLGVWVWWSNRGVTTDGGAAVSARELKADLMNGPSVEGDVPNAPKLKFDEYVLDDSVSLPTLPEQVKVYPLQTNLSVNQASKTPQKIGLNFDSAYSNPEAFAFTNFDKPQNLGYWVTNPNTGAFQFQSFGVHQPAAVQEESRPPENLIAKTFLEEIGVWENHLKFAATTKDDLNFTHVIFHRDWGKMGLPIINSVGLLNNSADKKIAQMTPGAASDFNTIEVVMTDDGRVWAVNSNLRPLDKQPLTLNTQQLKTPQQALAEVETGQGIFQMSAPVGEGTVDFNKVYPDGTARAGRATVTDFELVYLEKHAVAQKYLQPVYVARGRAQLASGYTVDWTQAVSAVRETGNSKVEAGQEARSWKVDSNSVLTNLKHPASTLASSIQSLVSYTQAQVNYDVTNTGLNVPGLGTFIICGESHTYCFKASTSAGEQKTVGEIRDKFFDLLAQEFMIINAQAAVSDTSVLNQVKTFSSIEDAYNFFAQRNGLQSISNPNNCSLVYACQADAAPLLKPDKPRLGCWNIIDDRLNTMTQSVAETLIAATQIAEPSPVETPFPTPTVDVTTTPRPDPDKTIFEPLAGGQNLTLNQWAQKDHIFPAETRRCITYTYAVSGARDSKTVGTDSVRISGESPTIFAYHAPKNLEIKLPEEKLTYREPLIDNRLYYEFDSRKVELEAGKMLGTIREENLTGAVQELAQAWGLTPPEAWALEVDLERAAAKIDSNYLKIQLATQESLNRELPLKIEPRPDTLRRIHLMLTPLNEAVKIPKPTIRPLKRKGFTVIELGASAL